MRQQEANTIAGCTIELILATHSGMADGPERMGLERTYRKLLALPSVREWIGYHLEVMQDENEVDKLEILARAGLRIEDNE